MWHHGQLSILPWLPNFLQWLHTSVFIPPYLGLFSFSSILSLGLHIFLYIFCMFVKSHTYVWMDFETVTQIHLLFAMRSLLLEVQGICTCASAGVTQCAPHESNVISHNPQHPHCPPPPTHQRHCGPTSFFCSFMLGFACVWLHFMLILGCLEELFRQAAGSSVVQFLPFLSHPLCHLAHILIWGVHLSRLLSVSSCKSISFIYF